MAVPPSRAEADGDDLHRTDAATRPATPPATDHLPGPEPPTPDANHPTTGAGPLPSGATLADGTSLPQATNRPSFVRHCPSSTNRDAYKKRTGRQLAPLLIDESGMGPRFHLLDNELFSARITGKPPSEADRKQFKSPKLWKGMLERQIYPQLGAVVKSVLDAAKCTKLRFLDTANHKSKDGNSGRKETFNDAGIYRNDSGLARNATDIDPKRLAKSKMSPSEIEERLLGARSWFWMDVPVEIKGDEKNSAFYFKTKPKGTWEGSEHTAAADKKPAEAESGQDGGPQEEAEGVEAVEEPPQAEERQDDGGEGDRDGDEEQQEERMAEDGDRAEDIENEDDADNEYEEYHDGEQTTAAIIRRPVPPFIKLSDNGEKALAQFVEYHLNIFKYQHRTFCYSIYICYDMARLLYFDRAGAYVSHAFSWVEPTSLLHEFVWKFAHFANAGKLGAMGHDTTATVVLPGRRRDFIQHAKNPALPAHVREGLKKASESGCPLYELVVQDVPPSPDEWFPDEPFPEPSTVPTSVRRFIVGRPHFSAEALVGRCTKGYMAFDVTDPKKWVPCFLKDSWRPCVPNRTRPEHLIYERLKRKKVKATDGIATMICGGDVGGSRAQRTRVQKDLPDANKPVLRVHYRLVTKDIGLPLWEFDNFGELSTIFVDALRGHRKAWDLAGVLHRDISVGNIMILTHEDGTRSGFLIDWDLSRLQCELTMGPVEPDRTGTWQFRSALSLRYPRKPYRRSDDIESFIHTYIYLVLRYHETNVGGLRTKVENLFEAVSLVGGIKIGGDDKAFMLSAGRVGFNVINNTYLQQLLKKILLHCKTTYDNIDSLEMERLYGPIPGAAQPGPTAQHGGPRNAPSTRPKRSMHHTSDDERPSASLDHIGSPPEKLSQSDDAHPGAPKEPCEIGLFLSDPTTLIKLLVEHAEEAYNYQDKAPDQFIARKCQDVARPSENPGTRSIGTLAVTGSFPSEEGLRDPASAADDDAEMSDHNSPASSVQSANSMQGGQRCSYDVPPATSRQKRTRAEDDDIADDEGESSGWPRRTKRVKGRKGKV